MSGRPDKGPARDRYTWDGLPRPRSRSSQPVARSCFAPPGARKPYAEAAGRRPFPSPRRAQRRWRIHPRFFAGPPSRMTRAKASSSSHPTATRYGRRMRGPLIGWRFPKRRSQDSDTDRATSGRSRCRCRSRNNAWDRSPSPCDADPSPPASRDREEGEGDPQGRAHQAPTERRARLDQVNRPHRIADEHEGSPITGRQMRFPPQQIQLGRAQRFRLRLSSRKVPVESRHQIRRSAVAHIPKTRHDRSGAGVKERLGQALHSLPGEDEPASRLAGRQNDELAREPQPVDVASSEETIRRLGARVTREKERRSRGHCPVEQAVRGEVDHLESIHARTSDAPFARLPAEPDLAGLPSEARD